MLWRNTERSTATETESIYTKGKEGRASRWDTQLQTLNQTRQEGEPQQHTESNAYQNKRGRDAAEQRATTNVTQMDKKDKHRQKLKLTWTHKGGCDTQQTENTSCYETWKYTETGNIKLKINDPQRKSHRLHGPWWGLSPRVTMDCISRRMWPSPLSAHEHFC